MKLLKQTETQLVFEKKEVDTISMLVWLILGMIVVPLIIIAIATPILIAIFLGILLISIVGFFIFLVIIGLSKKWDEIYKFDKSNNSFTIVFKKPANSNYFQQFLWRIVFWIWFAFGKKAAKLPKTINRNLSAIEAIKIIRSGSARYFYKIHFVLLPNEDSIVIPIKFVNSSNEEQEVKEVAECISSFLGLPKPQFVDITTTASIKSN